MRNKSKLKLALRVAAFFLLMVPYSVVVPAIMIYFNENC